MVIKPLKIIIPILSILGLWLAWTSYNYFFDSSKPTVAVYGLEENGYISGDFQCIVKGEDSYKVSHITIFLDGRLLVNKFRINKQEFEHPFIIPTKSLQDGRHNLKIEVVDSSFKKNTTLQEINFFVDNSPLQAVFVRPGEYKVFQGRTFHLQFQASKPIKQAKINLLSKSFECYPESPNSLIYECFVPISCEDLPNEYPFSVDIVDKTGTNLTLDGKFQIMPYPFKKQNLKVSSETKKEVEEIGLKQNILEEELEQLAKKSPKEKLWHGVFYIPIEMSKVTVEFGTKRITEEKGCYTHKALDISGMPKTVVWAPQDGIVIIKNRYASSGNTVVIDHGNGVFSLLFHLDSFANINVGDKLKRGNPVGKMGKTGYATGYHLHWEMRINNIPVDPMEWTKFDF